MANSGKKWKEHYDLNSESWLTDIPIIDNDAALQILNDKAEELYTSLYTLDEDNILVFDEESPRLQKKGFLIEMYSFELISTNLCWCYIYPLLKPLISTLLKY